MAHRSVCITIYLLMIGILAGLLLAPSTASAQGERPARNSTDERAADSYSSVYLPLGHWVYDYLDLLIARGRINSLSPLVRPYRRIDIAEAVLRAERDRQLSQAALRWVEAIRRELSDEVELLRSRREQEIEFHAELGAGLKALSHTHRDPLRPEGEENLFPTFRLRLMGEAPHVAGVMDSRWDNHLLNDPQFPGGRAIEFRECDPIVDECAYRPDEAYVELQFPYARLSLGRMDRNWGLSGQKGLLVSSYPYSYDHVGYRFGTERIALTGMYAKLEDFGGDTTHHFSTHRFDWRIADYLQVSVSESAVFGGPNRQIELNLISPLLPWEIAGVEGTERNSLGMAEIWFRIFDDLLTYGAFMVDNTSVGEEARGRSPGFNQFSGAFGLQLPSLRSNLALRGDVAIVSSLAYRSRVAPWQFYSVDGIGLARDKTDVLLMSLQADWFPRARLILKPRLDLMWKGEDDLTDPWPDDAFTRDRLFIGTIETTIRPSLGGRYHFPLGEVRWDLGLNLVKNDEHVEGRDWRAIGVGSVEVDLRRRF